MSRWLGAMVIGTALIGVAITGALASLAHAKAPRPVSGVVPLTVEDVVEAEGDRLHVDDFDMDLAGKRVRFLAEVDEVGKTSAGESYIAVEGDGERLVLRLPGPLDDPGRLDQREEWAVIARLDRPVTLANGERAIAVGPDILVKTPGLPGQIRPEDVVVEVAGAEFFGTPTALPWESAEPLYRLTVTDPGRNPERFLTPGPTALARSTKGGKQLYDYRQVTRAEDGSQLADRCVFELQLGRLRNTAFGEVELDPAGKRKRQRWVDFGSDKFHDIWSGARKPFPANTYQAACISVGMTGFPLEAGVMRFFVWGERGMPIPVYAFVDGRETLSTRGRSEEAYRIRIGLDVRRAAQQVDVPKPFKDRAEAAGETWYAGDSTYWIAATPPHDMLRFEGPLGPPGSPIVRIDRVR